MKNTLDRASIVGLILGLASALLIAKLWATPPDILSLAAGYVLFALNYLALKGISKTLVQVAVRGHSSTRAKLWLSLGSLAKFVGLIGALYLLLVVGKLSGFYLAFGSLLSLLVLTGLQVAAYLKSLASGGSARPKTQA